MERNLETALVGECADTAVEEYHRKGRRVETLDKEIGDHVIGQYFYDVFNRVNQGNVTRINASLETRINIGDQDAESLIQEGYGYVFTTCVHGYLTYELFVRPRWMNDVPHVIPLMICWYRFIRPSLDAWIESSLGDESMIMYHCHQYSSFNLFSFVRHHTLSLDDIIGYRINTAFTRFISNMLDIGECLGFYRRNGDIITKRDVCLYYVSRSG
jgi:hypothetical protein